MQNAFFAKSSFRDLGKNVLISIIFSLVGDDPEKAAASSLTAAGSSLKAAVSSLKAAGSSLKAASSSLFGVVTN